MTTHVIPKNYTKICSSLKHCRNLPQNQNSYKIFESQHVDFCPGTIQQKFVFFSGMTLQKLNEL